MSKMHFHQITKDLKKYFPKINISLDMFLILTARIRANDNLLISVVKFFTKKGITFHRIND